MIRSFGDKDTERLALGSRVARFAAFERVALRKLRQLQVADALSDLLSMDGGAEHVEIVDYH